MIDLLQEGVVSVHWHGRTLAGNERFNSAAIEVFPGYPSQTELTVNDTTKLYKGKHDDKHAKLHST
jgi:hypothetical protein